MSDGLIRLIWSVVNRYYPEGKVSFLKKLGQFLAKAVAIALGVGPIVAPFFGSSKVGQVAATALNDFTAIGQQVLQVEAVIQTPGSGPQKLLAAVPLVAGIVKTSELVSGKKIADEAKFTDGCTDLVNGMVKILNSIHADEAKTA